LVRLLIRWLVLCFDDSFQCLLKYIQTVFYHYGGNHNLDPSKQQVELQCCICCTWISKSHWTKCYSASSHSFYHGKV